jgi:hypothetical protein
MTRTSRGRRRTGLIVGSLALAGVPGSAGCSSPQAAISIGMTKSEVRARLGDPERIGVLNGKDIDTIAPDAEAQARGRVVYFYRDGRLAVWFEGTRVTGVTDTADASGTSDRQADDH